MNHLSKFVFATLLALSARYIGATEVESLRAERLESATNKLRVALEAKHPEVTQWSIRALAADRTLLSAPSESPIEMSVTAMGARSAVRLIWTRTQIPYSLTLWFDVKGVASVVVANRDARVGAVLSSADGVLTERDILAGSCGVLRSTDALENVRARLPLHRDAPICDDAVEPRPAVARGESVSVRFVSDRVAVTGKAIALADGRVGQSVSVKNAVSREVFRAVVSAMHEVTVHPERR